MRFITILLILFCCAQSFGQNITKLEYFIDNDPGFGNGTNVPISADTDVTASFNANINVAPTGFHWLYFRAKDANGNWSLTNYKLFLRSGIGNPNPSPITYIEYFV